MNAAHDETVPATDLTRVATLVDLLGRVRLLALLDLLHDRLAEMADAIAALPARHADILLIVHQSQGSAGSLGLNDVMAALQDLETNLGPAVTDADDSIHLHAVLAADARRCRELLDAGRRRIDHIFST